MRGRSEHWAGHVAGWKESGLSQRDYCERHGLVKGTMSHSPTSSSIAVGSLPRGRAENQKLRATNRELTIQTDELTTENRDLANRLEAAPTSWPR